ncbi:MAG: HEPN domain-containing protein [Bacteroidota bacterium]
MTQSLYTNTLTHLPAAKQKELSLIRERILERVKPEMVILFGSHATGKWVEDHQVEDGTVYEYQSDFDILVVTPAEKNYSDWVWQDIERKIQRDPRIGRTTLINHTIDFFDEKVRDQYYFFLDIYREGVLLYDSGNYVLEGPQELTPIKRLEKATDYFAYWMERGDDAIEGFKFYVGRKKYNEAAFQLHQATERYYATFLLIFTDYKPKTHDLGELRIRAGKVNAALQAAFLQRTEEERRVFELLKRAYVDARYDRSYMITAGELQYLSVRVHVLRALVVRLCSAEIQNLTKAVNGAPRQD